MSESAAKTSDNFVGVDPEYAVYTNDVDKPYPIKATKEEVKAAETGTAAPDSDASDDEKVEDDDKQADEPKVEPKATAAKTTSRPKN